MANTTYREIPIPEDMKEMDDPLNGKKVKLLSSIVMENEQGECKDAIRCTTFEVPDIGTIYTITDKTGMGATLTKDLFELLVARLAEKV